MKRAFWITALILCCLTIGQGQTIRPTRISQLELVPITTAQEATLTLSDGDMWFNSDIGCVRQRVGGVTSCLVLTVANSCSINAQVGATAGLRVQACTTALVSTGGTVYWDMSGSQTIATDVISGVTKNVQFEVTSGQYSFSANTTFPTNIAVRMYQGAKFTAPNGVTVTIRGSFRAPETTVFTWAGTGAFRFGGQSGAGFDALTPRISVYWWGAVSDGVTDSSAATTAAFAALCTGGGTIQMYGRFLSVTPPTLCASVSNGAIIVEVAGTWDVGNTLTWTRRHTLKCVGSPITGFSRQVITRGAVRASSFASDVPLISITDTNGNMNFEGCYLTSNKNAPVVKAVQTGGLDFYQMYIQNTNTGTSAHAIELDGVFWAWFRSTVTSTARAGTYTDGPFNYKLEVTSNSTQDTGLIFINDSQLNGSGIEFSGNRAPTGLLGNLIVRNTTIENNGTPATILLNRANNIYPSFITLDGVTDADGSATANFECTGSPTVGNVIRGITIRHNEFQNATTATCSGQQIEFTSDDGHAFTGNLNPGTDQKLWKYTNYGPLDARWLYAGGLFSPSWIPFAAPSAVPSQTVANWSAYTEVTGNATTVTGTILAPDGSTTAGRMTCASGSCGKYVDQNLTLAADDWIAFGGWARSNDATTVVDNAVYQIQAVGGCATFNGGLGVTATSAKMDVEANQQKRVGTSIGWYPINRVIQVATSVSNPCTIRFSMNQSSTQPTDRWKPFLMQIPASSNIPYGDVIRAWRAGAFNNIDTACLANEICVMGTSVLSGDTLKSRVATGTAPLTVASTTKVSNLNADLLDGFNSDTDSNANTVGLRWTAGEFKASFFYGNGTVAGSGTFRTSAGGSFCFRNAANNGDICLSKNGSDGLTGSGAMSSVWSISLAGDGTFRRFKAAGTALVAGDFALDANWGAGAAVSAVTGTDQAWQITVTAAGVPALNAGVTLTFKDGTWTNAPICQAQVIGGTGAVADMTGLPTATTWPLVYVAVPVAASTYIITGMCMGR